MDRLVPSSDLAASFVLWCRLFFCKFFSPPFFTLLSPPLVYAARTSSEGGTLLFLSVRFWNFLVGLTFFGFLSRSALPHSPLCVLLPHSTLSVL